MIPVRPNKVADILTNKPHTRGWYKMEVNIAKNGLMGPFNFTTQQDGKTTETHRIREEIWKALEAEIREEETTVDISDVHTKHPFT
jgi:divalent metal cation (Fe/Co/Zn/Cd) transporter